MGRKAVPEDAAMGSKEEHSSPLISNEAGGDSPGGAAPVTAENFGAKDRIYNININDKENVPYALFLIWFIILINEETCVEVCMWVSIAWVVCRLLHTVFYYCGLQPWRSLIWMVGQLAAIVLIFTL